MSEAKKKATPKIRQSQSVRQNVVVKINLADEKRKRRRRKRRAPTQARQRRKPVVRNFYGDPNDGNDVPPRPKFFMTNVGDRQSRITVNSETGIPNYEAMDRELRQQELEYRRRRLESLKQGIEDRQDEIPGVEARGQPMSTPEPVIPQEDRQSQESRSQSRGRGDGEGEGEEGRVIPMEALEALPVGEPAEAQLEYFTRDRSSGKYSTRVGSERGRKVSYQEAVALDKKYKELVKADKHALSVSHKVREADRAKRQAEADAREKKPRGRPRKKKD